MQFLVLRLDNVHDVDDVANGGLLSICHMDHKVICFLQNLFMVFSKFIKCLNMFLVLQIGAMFLLPLQLKILIFNKHGQHPNYTL